MKADTAIKQEALADLDDDIANYGQTGGKVWVIMMDQWVMILMEICHEILLEK